MSKAKVETAIRRVFGGFRREGTSECVVECPFCGAEKMYINSDNEVYICFRCGDHGGSWKLWHDVLHGVRPRGERRRWKPEKKRSIVGSVYPCDNPETDCRNLSEYDSESGPGMYVISRFGARKDGFSMKWELEEYWDVQVCERGRKFADGLYNTTYTLIFPIDDASGDCVGWQSRMMLDPDKIPEEGGGMYGWKFDQEKNRYIRPPKYFTCPGWDKGSTLYNISKARQGDLIILTEGVFDVFAAGRSAVCALGKSLSDTQKCLLKAWSKCIVLLLDPDAEEEQNRLAEELKDDRHLVVPVHLEGFKDAGDAGRREVVRQVRAALEAEAIDPDDFTWFHENPGEGLRKIEEGG